MNSPKLFVCLFALYSGFLVPTAAVDAQSKSRRAWTTSRVKGAPTPPSPFKVVSAFPDLKFERPTSVVEFPTNHQMLVTEMGGKIFSFTKSAKVKQADLLIDLKDVGCARLWSAALHPNFTQNRFVFVCYVGKVGSGEETRVSRFTMQKKQPPQILKGSEQVMITWPAGGHNGGCLRFGKDGMLYISTGDGSGPNPPDGRTTGQDVSDLLGAILRINVDRSSSENYSTPGDNPFVGVDNARPEIWAYGLRNPWKFGIDSKSGSIFVADNGWESWEMVHRIVKGGNCGWPVMEGRAALRSEVKIGPTPIIPPVKDHAHTEANSVIGGPVYRGSKLPSLNGVFIYGDYITGTIWGLNSVGQYSHSTLVDTDLRIVDFTEGSAGELYVLDFDFTGQIYELVPSGLKDTSADFPRRLSKTGLFSSLNPLTPAAGVEPYSVTVPRWMDGANSKRWLALPNQSTGQISTIADGPLQMPEGTVFVKQVNLPIEGQSEVRLETQILHFENGSWNPYSYLWNEAGTDARLVDSIGTDRTLQVPDQTTDQKKDTQRTWHVSAVNECRLCHNAGSNYVLGFRPEQLGLEQMTDLQAHKIADPTKAAQGVVSLTDPHDKTKDLNDRARSYLHANCSSCHNPRGNAIVSFYLRHDMPFDELKTNKGTGIGTFGMRNAKLIVPGDPYRSVVMYRMSKLGYARMPYIGSQVVDSAGVALIDEWIRSMPAGDNATTNSAPQVTGSSQFKALQQLLSGKSEDQAAELSNLLKSSEGSLALVARLHGGAMNESVFANAVKQGSQSSSDIAGLFETFLPEDQRRKRLGPNPKPESILSLKGDLARGRLIFNSDGARCRNCHDIRDASKSLGPTLLDINKKYPRRNEMLQHALKPTLKIDDKYAVYMVVTNSGRVHSGMLLERTADHVRIRTARKENLTIKTTDIDEVHKSKLSLMPNGVLGDLTAQEAADLLTYLRSLGAAPN